MYGDARVFIEQFNQLEHHLDEVLKRHSHLTAREGPYIPFSRKVDLLVGERVIGREYQSELHAFAMLRNAIVHNLGRGGEAGRIIAAPLQTTVDRLGAISSALMRPPTVEAIMVRRGDMVCAELTTSAGEVIRRMKQERFSYVPVLETDRLIGVFSQETLFSRISRDDAFLVEKTLTMADFQDLLPLDRHDSEGFAFIGRTASIRDAEAAFGEVGPAGKRLEILFITEQGRVDQKLLGLTTIWDLAGWRSDPSRLY